MFWVLSDIHLGSGSNNTHNPKYQKQDPFGIYVEFGSVRIHFYRIGFGSDFQIFGFNLFAQPYYKAKQAWIILYNSYSLFNLFCISRMDGENEVYLT